MHPLARPAGAEPNAAAHLLKRAGLAPRVSAALGALGALATPGRRAAAKVGNV
jgi:hypothetical protein